MSFIFKLTQHFYTFIYSSLNIDGLAIDTMQDWINDYFIESNGVSLIFGIVLVSNVLYSPFKHYIETPLLPHWVQFAVRQIIFAQCIINIHFLFAYVIVLIVRAYIRINYFSSFSSEDGYSTGLISGILNMFI